MTDRRELLLGCGHQRKKLIVPPGAPEGWSALTTLDNNAACDPDILGSLDAWDWQGMLWNRVPNLGTRYDFLSNTFDEVHAYEVLEHLGAQGNVASFFNTFAMIWKVLKADGFLCATVPSRYSEWLWGDPGHCRAILPCTLIFLDQSQYTAQLGRTAMSDYREIYKADFRIVHSSDDRVFHKFVLQAVKPSRYLPGIAK